MTTHAAIQLPYTIPGLPPHEGATVSLADAIEIATQLASRTGAPAAILAHRWMGDHEEVSIERMVPVPGARAASHPVRVLPAER